MTSHDDLHRDIGGLTAGMESLQRAVADLTQEVRALRAEVEGLKLKDAQRGALEKAAIWLAGVVGAAVTLIISHVWK